MTLTLDLNFHHTMLFTHRTTTWFKEATHTYYGFCRNSGFLFLNENG